MLEVLKAGMTQAMTLSQRHLNLIHSRKVKHSFKQLVNLLRKMITIQSGKWLTVDWMLRLDSHLISLMLLLFMISNWLSIWTLLTMILKAHSHHSLESLREPWYKHALSLELSYSLILYSSTLLLHPMKLMCKEAPNCQSLVRNLKWITNFCRELCKINRLWFQWNLLQFDNCRLLFIDR